MERLKINPEKLKKETQLKMNFWEDEFLNKDENFELVYSSSTFLKNKDKKAITEALDFLKNHLVGTYEFLNSKVMQDFKNGKLPEMEISMATITMAKLSLALIVGALIVVFIAKRM